MGEPLEIDMDRSHLVSLILGTAVTVWYGLTKHWCGNNLFGLCFSIQGVENINIGSFKVGVILLSVLFLYDIFWVFGTDVMVTVAKSFDAPIKLLFPRAFATADTAMQFSMLGLGDIVMPGIFIALILRFDFQRFTKPGRVANMYTLANRAFAKPMFNAVMLSYVLGLVATVFVMYKFQAAQPALLYLVPACLGSAFATAFVRGELDALWKYSEEEPVVDTVPNKKKNNAGSNAKSQKPETIKNK